MGKYRQLSLEKYPSTAREYKDIPIESIKKLTPHSYISRAQTSYLQKMSDNPDNFSAVVLVDFAENYSFVVQDEVQAFLGTTKANVMENPNNTRS